MSNPTIDPGDYFTAAHRLSSDCNGDSPDIEQHAPGIFSIMTGRPKYIRPRTEIWRCIATDGTYISAKLFYADEHERVPDVMSLFEMRAYDLELVCDDVAESLV